MGSSGEPAWRDDLASSPAGWAMWKWIGIFAALLQVAAWLFWVVVVLLLL